MRPSIRGSYLIIRIVSEGPATGAVGSKRLRSFGAVRVAQGPATGAALSKRPRSFGAVRVARGPATGAVEINAPILFLGAHGVRSLTYGILPRGGAPILFLGAHGCVNMPCHR